jgi:hypothetical protein
MTMFMDISVSSEKNLFAARRGTMAAFRGSARKPQPPPVHYLISWQWGM